MFLSSGGIPDAIPGCLHEAAGTDVIGDWRHLWRHAVPELRHSPGSGRFSRQVCGERMCE
jgi:hypothetical protein